MQILRATVLAVVLSSCFLTVQAEMIPPDAVIASVTYHLPVAYRNGEQAEKDNTWDQRQRSVDVTLRNTGYGEIAVTGGELIVTAANGVEEARVADGWITTEKVPTAKIPARGQCMFTIDPTKFGYFFLLSGKPYVVRIVWQLNINGAQGTYTQVFPYFTPDPTPVFASEWVTSEGVGARLLLRQGAKRGLQVFAEFKNETQQPVEMILSPYVEHVLRAREERGFVITNMKVNGDLPVIPVTLHPGGTVAVALSAEADYGHLLFMPDSYVLTSGEYRLSATLSARTIRTQAETSREWKLPVLTFLVPLPNPLPVFEPLQMTSVD